MKGTVVTTEGATMEAKEGPSKRTVALFTAALVFTVLFVVGGTWYAVFSANRQVQSSCGFWRSLAVVPIVAVPPLKVPSKFGVTIVLTALDAYDGQGCGHLAPTAQLVQWAGYYHLALP